MQQGLKKYIHFYGKQKQQGNKNACNLYCLWIHLCSLTGQKIIDGLITVLNIKFFWLQSIFKDIEPKVFLLLLILILLIFLNSAQYSLVNFVFNVFWNKKLLISDITWLMSNYETLSWLDGIFMAFKDQMIDYLINQLLERLTD